MAEVLRGRFGPEQLAPLQGRHKDARITTSKLLPKMLVLKEKGHSYREIGEALGVTRKAVEHVFARNRKMGSR